MPYIVTNTKPRVLGGFAPGPNVIPDDKYKELKGSDKDKKLTCPQAFFNEKVEMGILKVDFVSGTVGSGSKVQLVAGMNEKDAVKYCSESLSRKLLEKIVGSDKRDKVKKAAEKKLNELNKE